jgi:predicted NAD-dependent protein-ADP-ribosyltransferase YbiA (DUF1768 family)
MAETEDQGIGAEAVEDELAVEEGVQEIELPVLPYTKEMLAVIYGFFKGRAKNPGFYTYTSGGDLEIKPGAEGRGKKKVIPGTIPLHTFVPLDPAERELLEQKRLESLSALDEEYEAENLVLKAAWEEYEATQSMRAVLNSNQRLTEIDAKRNAARSLVRECISLPNPTIRDILLSERYEERKMFSPGDPFEKSVVRMAFYPFPAEVEMGKYVPDDVLKGGGAEAEEEYATPPNEMLYRQRMKDGRWARIFYDTNSEVNGFLSPLWPVDFTLAVGGKESRYSSALQAYQVERVKELGNTALAESLMKTRSPRTILLLVRQIKGHPKEAKGLWLKIYTAIYSTYPNLAARLLATGSDTLVFADVREGPSSIGLAETDSAALDPAKWKGENAVGLAQETVRTRLREETLEEAPQTEDVDASVITEEEQEKAKIGAIINAKRRG